LVGLGEAGRRRRGSVPSSAGSNGGGRKTARGSAGREREVGFRGAEFSPFRGPAPGSAGRAEGRGRRPDGAAVPVGRVVAVVPGRTMRRAARTGSMNRESLTGGAGMRNGEAGVLDRAYGARPNGAGRPNFGRRGREPDKRGPPVIERGKGKNRKMEKSPLTAETPLF